VIKICYPQVYETYICKFIYSLPSIIQKDYKQNSMNQIVIIRNYSELGAGTRGASLGPEAIEVAAMNRNNPFFSKFENIELRPLNNFFYEKVTTPYAKHVEGIVKIYEDVSKHVCKTITDGNFPFIMAGDHSSAGGTISGVKKAFPDQIIGVVWIDAHGDLHSPYTSPSGNVHGMPLATALAVDNKKYALNQVVDETKDYWEYLKNIHGITPKILPENLIFFGVRDTELPEDMLMDELGIRNFTVDERKKKGAIRSAREAIDLLNDCDKIYISFDVDVMDCDKISHGTGTPVPNGILQPHVIDIIREFLNTGKVCCFEVVEVNPTLDEKKNAMAEAAFDVIEALTPNFLQFTK
jgi:arginase